MGTQENYIWIRQLGSSRMKYKKNCCIYEGIELLCRNWSATGMVERTIGSLKNYVLTYLRENKNHKFGSMISRALSALRLVPHSKTNLTPFEAYHGREANTAPSKFDEKTIIKKSKLAKCYLARNYLV